MAIHPLKRYALMAIGSLALALGLIGMAVPILPTTPFLLLAAFCYMRSSHRLYAWLTGHRLFGPTIRNYIRHRAISGKTRIRAMLFLWASLLTSMFLVDRRPVRLLLLVVGLGVSWHLAALRTMPVSERTEADERPDREGANGP